MHRTKRADRGRPCPGTAAAPSERARVPLHVQRAPAASWAPGGAAPGTSLCLSGLRANVQQTVDQHSASVAHEKDLQPEEVLLLKLQ